MNYEEALKRWGLSKVREWYPEAEAWAEVKVEMNFNEGFACCGGTDPLCYCSFAESPSANVTITMPGFSRRIDAYDFDFATMVRELAEIAGGFIAAE